MVEWFMERLRHRRFKPTPAPVSREQTLRQLREEMALLEQQSTMGQHNNAVGQPRRSAHRAK